MKLRLVVLWSASSLLAAGALSAGTAGALALPTPTLTTQASAAVSAGGSIRDAVTLAGGSTPSGIVTVKIYGPNDANCSAAAANTSTITVSGDGTFQSIPYTPASAGTYRFVASYGGNTGNNPVSGACNDANESVVVSAVTPTLSTQASAATTLGNPIADTATLAGGVNPTGTITFKVYGPNLSVCGRTVANTSTATVSGNGSYSSTPFTPTALGTYQFVASYGGDANNAAVSGACNGANESVVVGPAATTLTSQASATTTLGGSISDTVTLSGGSSPTGNITVKAYGPNDANCSGTVVNTSSLKVTGNGAYSSNSFTPTAAGTYRFVASYDGDSSNAAASGACNDANESVVVGSATPTISSQASAATTLGHSISDTATLTGGVTPTGIITFKVYGPNVSTCKTAVDTSTATVTGDGTYTSKSFSPTAAGTYRFIASYGGDANNAAVSGSCTDATEAVVVGVGQTSLVGQASAGTTLGGTIADSVTLAGGVNPTGTITVKAYGPDDASCAGTAVSTSSITVTGNGSYTSTAFAPSAAGTYRFIASYSGDTNNGKVTGACNQANQAVAVQAQPTLSGQASAEIVLGGTISDSVTLAGGASPTGTITVKAYGPNDVSCSNTAVNTSSITVSGNGIYSSTTFTPTVTGTYQFVASYSGDSHNTSVTGPCGDPNQSVIVDHALSVGSGVPTSVVAGENPDGDIDPDSGGPVTLTSSATLDGGISPTGTVTINVYGPDNPTCTGAPVQSAGQSLRETDFDENGRTIEPVYFTFDWYFADPGTYHFVASYRGDSRNSALTEACNDASNTVVVTPVSPSISGSLAQSSVTIGQPSDYTVDLQQNAGGLGAPTGTITIDVYGPNDPTCSNGSIETETVSTTDPEWTGFIPGAIGTYEFVAEYGGDTSHSSVSTACGAADTVLEVDKATPTFVSKASATTTLGKPITDDVTWRQSYGISGTITLTAYGPDDASCTGTPPYSFSFSAFLYGEYGTVFTPIEAGTYRFVASYSGDDNNNAVTEDCNDPGNSVVVSPATPTLSTQASAGVRLGGSISDKAALTNGEGPTGPTGTITFKAYGPDDTTCSGTPTVSVVAVNGDGNYVSSSFAPTTAGTYLFVASYSGDANNNPVSGSCGDADESVTVSPVSTVPTVTKVSPTSGSTAGGTSVTVTGSGFTGATAVTFGGTAGTSLVVNSDTSVTVTSPAHAAGTVNVRVTTPAGQSAVVTPADQFTYSAAPVGPTVTKVSPSSGSSAGGTSVTVTGTGFTGATAVTFGGTAGTNVVVKSATSITVTSPKHAAGAVNVRVTTPAGQSAVVTPADQFTYSAAPVTPTVTKVSPASGPTAGGTSVTVTGTGFTGATAVTFGGTAGTNVVVKSATSITVTSPKHAAGAVNVRVTTPAGQSAVVTPADQFTYTAAPATPKVTDVSPGDGDHGGGTAVTITGSGFTGATAVTFGGVAATDVVVVSDTEITAVSPAHAVGTTNVRVTTPTGQSPIVKAAEFIYTET
ncbi:MAG TPA: IPT/TIG domain-containing protein [Mycobacteriales bacterium]|nr:IPT/TIG domain-containing protein [Mycobacteriales bacterium]